MSHWSHQSVMNSLRYALKTDKQTKKERCKDAKKQRNIDKVTTDKCANSLVRSAKLFKNMKVCLKFWEWFAPCCKTNFSFRNRFGESQSWMGIGYLPLCLWNLYIGTVISEISALPTYFLNSVGILGGYFCVGAKYFNEPSTLGAYIYVGAYLRSYGMYSTVMRCWGTMVIYPN